MDNRSIGENISRLRQSIGMSQDELAKKCGYNDRSSITKIEKGERDLPQSKIVAVAKALGTTPQYLLNWDEEMSQDNSKNFHNTKISTNQKLTEHERKVLDAYRSQPCMQLAVDRLLGIDNEINTEEYITGQAVAKGGKSRKLKISPEDMAEVHRLHEEEVKEKMKK